ncbi:MAG: large subunit ribosomal protein [Patescibacteria group bacterium]|nr:large subunit ribosomal protein [Patescibacteria group bacterium]
MSEEKEIVEVPEKFKKLVEEIEKMSVLDLSELVKVLEDKFGVSAAPQMVAGAAPVAGGDVAPAEEEKSSFDVVLTSAGEKKIEVIKVVRDLTQKGLKEAKDLVDEIATGAQTIKEGVEKKEAEEIKQKFVDAGATVELK